MPDITMCLDRDCPLHRQCYRYTAEPDGDEAQSYFVNSPREGATCDFFWSDEPEKPLRPV